MKRVLAAALALGIIIPAAAFPPQEVIRDGTGHDFLPGPPPRRIVSLAPNITEILFALGLGSEIVGVTRFCDVPEAALGKPKVGGLIDPSPEMIQSLKPDLVIGFRGNPLPAIRRLRSLGLRVFVLDIGKTLEDISPMIEKLGLVTGREKEAAALAAGLTSRLAAVDERLKTAASTPRVFLLLHGSGLWTCGRGSYLDDLLSRSRARNPAGTVEREWIHYSFEGLVRDDPEIIIILARTKDAFEKTRKRIMTDPRLRDVAAIRGGRLIYLDENISSRFGPRLVDALEETARSIHPDVFGSRP